MRFLGIIVSMNTFIGSMVPGVPPKAQDSSVQAKSTGDRDVSRGFGFSEAITALIVDSISSSCLFEGKKTSIPASRKGLAYRLDLIVVGEPSKLI